MTPENELSGREIYARLLRHTTPYWRPFGWAVLAMVALAATQPAIPALLKPALDGSFVNKEAGAATFMAFALVGLFLVRGIAEFTSVFLLATVAARVVMDLRELMFAKLVALPVDYYNHQASGVLISKVTYDANQVTEAATTAVTVIVRDGLAVAGLLAWMLYLDWQLSLIAFVTGPVLLLMVRYLGRRLRSMSQSLQSSMGDITHVVEEAIEGQRVVRMFGAQDYERSRFERAANRVRQFQVKFNAASAVNGPLVQLMSAVALALIIYVAGQRASVGQFTVGTFVSFFVAMSLLFQPLKRLTGVQARIQRGIAAAESVFHLMDEPPEVDTGTEILPRAAGRIELRDVCFEYRGQGRPALDGVNLVVEPGETVALVGPSGGGKTTLVNLIPRFYHPQSGMVLLDDKDIATLSLESLRANIALVSQEIVLFNDTVAANIAYGREGQCPRERIVEAAVAAHAQEFIEGLPKGLDTEVGQRGVRLSGGQRQRLAIARAFLKDAPVLILDEATSSLDTAAERHIQSALEALQAGRTTIVIAHRLSSVQRANRIALVEAGRIVDVGSHDELLGRSKLYSTLYHFQFSRDDEPASSSAAR